MNKYCICSASLPDIWVVRAFVSTWEVRFHTHSLKESRVPSQPPHVHQSLRPAFQHFKVCFWYLLFRRNIEVFHLCSGFGGSCCGIIFDFIFVLTFNRQMPTKRYSALHSSKTHIRYHNCLHSECSLISNTKWLLIATSKTTIRLQFITFIVIQSY